MQDQPVSTIAIQIDGGDIQTSGGDTMFIPDAFADDLRNLLAALDWARVHNTAGQRYYGALAHELAAAAKSARAIADDCEAFANAAHDQACAF